MSGPVPASSFSPSISLLLSTSVGQGLQNSFLLEVETQGLHVADQPALPVADVGKRFGKLLLVPVKAGPAVEFVDIHSPHLLRRL